MTLESILKKHNAAMSNPIKFINLLAEMTRHRDREIIESSLLTTLLEFEVASHFSLYQVLGLEPDIKLGLLASASYQEMITPEELQKQHLPSDFQQAILKVIKSGKVVTLQQTPTHNYIQVIYPAFDTDGNILAILVQTTKQLDYQEKALVHGFLRIYSNYLELIEISKRDKLTGLLNRQTLESEIQRILKRNTPVSTLHSENQTPENSRERQQKSPLTYWICILDIDHFKDVNDKYGHIYGDEVLILVARLLEKSVRECDKIFRFGGEEFVVLMRAFDQEDARLGFERIRRVIKTHQYAKIDTLTVSIGGKEIAQQNDPREVISDADNALYYAKNHGRDQVQIYEMLLEERKIQ